MPDWLCYVGEIMMVVPVPSSGAGRGWEDMGDGHMAANMYRFMQRDIDEGRIWYKHKGSSSRSDFFKFEVCFFGVKTADLQQQKLF